MTETITRTQLEATLSIPRNEGAVVALFQSATEANRRDLAPTALVWYRAAYSQWIGSPRKTSITLPDVGVGHVMQGICVAVLATATWPEMRSLTDWDSIDTRLTQELVYDVLSARRPNWIDEWAEAYVEAEPTHWPVVRKLVRSGYASRSDSDAMISGMLAGVDSIYVYTPAPTIRENLEADPELLEHEIWRMFEVQRPNNLSFASRDEWRNAGRTRDNQPKRDGWLETFIQLANEGRLPRIRLLEESLTAIEREYPEAISRWFPKLHEALAPSLQERLGFLSRYWKLLQSQNGSSVTFALECVKHLDHAGVLPEDETVEQISNLLMHQPKTRAKAALQLLERIAKRRKDLAPLVAIAATKGLSHEAAEIQEASWKLITKHGDSTNASLIDAIRSTMENVAFSLKERLTAWLLSTSGSPNSISTSEAARHVQQVGEESSPLNDLFREARDLPSDLAALARIPDLIESNAYHASELPVVRLRSWNYPRLAKSIVSIMTVEDLIDAASAAVEQIDSADELERIIDGISRLCDQRPDDFEQRTAPLKKRTLAKLHGRGVGNPLAFVGDSFQTDLRALIWAWLTGEVIPLVIVSADNIHQQNLYGCIAGGEKWGSFPPSEPSWIRSAFSQRIRYIAQRVSKRKPQALLSAPTHCGGWIDPVVLVNRLLQQDARTAQAADFDHALALLRLAPERRSCALRLLGSYQSEFAEALRLALGADNIDIGPTASLWCAAARARAPWSDDDRVEQRHRNQGPDAGKASSYHATYSAAGIEFTVTPPRIPLEPQRWNHIPSGRLSDQFTIQSMNAADPHPVRWLHDGLTRLWLQADGPLIVRWAFTLWPACSDALFARATPLLLKNIDWKETLWSNRVYLERLIGADEPLEPVALLVLLIGLSSKEPGEVNVATDVAIAAISDGRLNGSILGEAMKSAISTNLFKLSRFHSTLKEIARPSLLHADIVRAALAHLFTGDTDHKIRDLGGLLELLLELSNEVGQPIPDSTHEWLIRYSGYGKGAKAVKQLITFNPTPNSYRHLETLRIALRGRIDRVQRWQSYIATGVSQFDDLRSEDHRKG